MRVEFIPEKGKGVFAEKTYAKDALVLRHEILVIPSDASEKIQDTFLDNYLFFMEDVYFLALGQGSLLNHSAEPTLYYRFHKTAQQITFYALREIKADEELTIDYEWESYPWEKAGHEQSGNESP